MLDWQEDELQSAEQEQAEEVHQEVEKACSGSKDFADEARAHDGNGAVSDMLAAWVESIWR